MESEAFQKYLKDRYEPQMKYYSDASKKNKTIYHRYQTVLIVLSALTPVFAALKGLKVVDKTADPAVDLNLLVVLISSVVAIMTSLLKTFNYQETWIRSRTTLNKLKPEKFYFDCDSGPYAEKEPPTKESLFVTRVEAILGNELDQWPPAKELPPNPQK